MSQASRRTGSGEQDRSERLRSRVAVFVTALLHLLLVLLVMWSPPVTLAPPQGGDAGGSLDVTFIDPSLRTPPPAHKPVARVTVPRRKVKPAPKASRLRTTLVAQSRDPAPPEVDDAADAPRPDTPAPSPSAPAATPADAADAATPPSQPWGMPPGMLPQDVARAGAGMARSAGGERGRGAAASGTSMEAEGYQVYYDLVSETRLRAWRDQGMTELFLPLPGTRRLMVCPMEIILRRGSGPCRMVEPDAPELTAIGDARDVIGMQQVYKLGELVWSGPGAYR